MSVIAANEARRTKRPFVTRAASLLLVLTHLFVIALAECVHLMRLPSRADVDFQTVSWLVIYTFIIIIMSYGLGFPEISDPSLRVRNSMVIAVGAPALFAAVQFFTGLNRIARITFLLSVPLVAVGNYLLSVLVSRWSVATSVRKSVLVVASAENFKRLIDDQKTHSEIDFQVMRSVDPDSPRSLQCFVKPLPRATTVIVIDDDILVNHHLMAEVVSLQKDGYRIQVLSQFYEEFLGKISLKHVSSAALTPATRNTHDRFYRFVSRAIDVVVGSAGLLLLAPLSLFVLVGNRFANRGPLLFQQTRVGRDNQNFAIIKFRTMRAGTSTSDWTQVGDARITPFGKFLRVTHLDELPQCINMIRGEITLVGPRPEQSHYVNLLNEAIPFYDARHRVTPGLTGWAQVNYPYGSSEVDAFEKLQFDLWYIRHQSIALDLRIVLRTVRHLLRIGGR